LRVLIVEDNADLAAVWAGFLGRQGMVCTIAATPDDAYAALRASDFDALILDMEVSESEAVAVADFATYRNPNIPIIAVTARNFFSDGLLFQLIPNARGHLRRPLRLEDMAAIVEHYGSRTTASSRP